MRSRRDIMRSQRDLVATLSRSEAISLRSHAVSRRSQRPPRDTCDLAGLAGAALQGISRRTNQASVMIPCQPATWRAAALSASSIGPSRDLVRSVRSRRDFVAISTRSLCDLARSGGIFRRLGRRSSLVRATTSTIVPMLVMYGSFTLRL